MFLKEHQRSRLIWSDANALINEPSLQSDRLICPFSFVRSFIHRGIMNRVEKSAAIEQYKALFDGIESMVLVDTSGVSVNSINEVRSKFRAEGVTFVVIKNTLAAHALQGTELEPVTALFKGPIAIALKKDDPVTPAKIVAAFAKDNPKFEIRGGFAFGKVLDIKGVDDLSKTKGKKELLAEVLSLFKASQTRFAAVIKAYAEKLEEAQSA